MAIDQFLHQECQSILSLVVLPPPGRSTMRQRCPGAFRRRRSSLLHQVRPGAAGLSAMPFETHAPHSVGVPPPRHPEFRAAHPSAGTACSSVQHQRRRGHMPAEQLAVVARSDGRQSGAPAAQDGRCTRRRASHSQQHLLPPVDGHPTPGRLEAGVVPCWIRRADPPRASAEGGEPRQTKMPGQSSAALCVPPELLASIAMLPAGKPVPAPHARAACTAGAARDRAR